MGADGGQSADTLILNAWPGENADTTRVRRIKKIPLGQEEIESKPIFKRIGGGVFGPAKSARVWRFFLWGRFPEFFGQKKIK